MTIQISFPAATRDAMTFTIRDSSSPVAGRHRHESADCPARLDPAKIVVKTVLTEASEWDE